jgi:cation:H+ antiporter
MSEHVWLFAAGLGLLAAGTGALVAGAARLDRATGRGAFAVGLVAVGCGPPVAGLALDLALVLRPAEGIDARRLAAAAVGRLIGGNVVSVLLVLGVGALVRPVASSARLFGTATPLAIGAALLFWLLAADNVLSRVDAGVLLTAFVCAVVLLVRAARREPDAGRAAFAGWVPDRLPVRRAGLLALGGLGAVVFGAWLAAGRLLPAAAVLRLSAPVTGLTLAALGTALPAAVAAAVASRRGRSDVVLGLAVGPLLCNLSVVAGAVALVQPLALTEHAILNEVPAMGLCAFLLLPALLNGKVPRWEGALLLAAYAGFVTWQVLRVPR